MSDRSLSSRLRKPLLAVALFSAALLITLPAHAQRLSSSVRPAHYTIALAPDLKTATYTGKETIAITLDQAETAITLNAIEIAFQSVEAVTATGETQTATVSLDEKKQQATFTFAKPLPAGKATLKIAFTGILNNELRGFYLSKTAKRNYAVTQFESTDARRAFPCFDEPAFKATYDVALTIDAADTAISNSPIISDKPAADGKHTLAFATTPKMSTYLVAFLVGDFECTSGSQDGVAIRVCSTPDKIALTKFGLDEAKKILHYYNNYFGIPYPLKKLDLIGIPDFEAGAMENFGAITYRETVLLVDEKTASVGAKKEVSLVIAHEMAHQWFGDLVTMKWWDNLWLNEGFATWMENKPVAALHPEWNIDQEIAASQDGTLNTDALPTTRTIRATADTPEEINQMFDGIAYGKAGAVLQSVENYLGPELFRQGVHKYLAAHLYSNATAEDFWNAQTVVSHKPVDRIMNSLVSQAGVPLVSFGKPAHGTVAVEQKRFFLSPSQKIDPAQKWTLPVCMKIASGKQDCQILTPETKALKVPTAPFFFANANDVGYYRSAYAPEDYKTLVAHAESALTPAERIGLVGNEWAQVRANTATAGDYLDLVAALKNDKNAAVLSSALSGSSAIKWRVASTKEERAALEAWIRSTFAPAYAKLPAPKATDAPNLLELRATLFGLLGGAKDPAVIAQAREIAAKYMSNPASVDATLGQTALAITVENGDAALFDQLQKQFETSTNPELQIGALRLLVQFENPELVRRALDYAASGKVRNQDAAVQFAIALQVPASRDLTWKYIKDNWEKVQAQLTTAMGGVLVSSTGSFCSTEAHSEVAQFFAAHPVPSSDRALKSALERIDGCVELRTLQGPKLRSWLDAQPK